MQRTHGLLTELVLHWIARVLFSGKGRGSCPEAGGMPMSRTPAVMS